MILELIAKINFLALAALLIIVVRHYAFFLKGAPSVLKRWIRRVFLGDILMALSVVLFNVTQYFMSAAEYNDNYSLKLALKLLQLCSILYAGWANVGLYKVMRRDE